MTGSEWLAIPGAIVALGALFGFLRKGFRFMARVDGALPTLFTIAAEFHNNGGSSLKDRIDNLDRTIGERTARFDTLDQRLGNIEHTLVDHTAQDTVNFAILKGMVMARRNSDK